MYPSTRRELAEKLPKEFHGLLVDWLWECPSELIPDDAQITEVRAILVARPEAKDPVVEKLVAECDDFLTSERIRAMAPVVMQHLQGKMFLGEAIAVALPLFDGATLRAFGMKQRVRSQNIEETP